MSVHGYTKPEQSSIDLVNQNKVLEEIVLRQADRLITNTTVDPRWVAIAKTHFQEGFMALNRAVFQPTRLVPQTSDAQREFEEALTALLKQLKG